MNFRSAISWGLVVVLLLFAARFIWFEIARDPAEPEFVREADAPAKAPGAPSAEEQPAVADADAGPARADRLGARAGDRGAARADG